MTRTYRSKRFDKRSPTARKCQCGWCVSQKQHRNRKRDDSDLDQLENIC